MRTSSLKQLLLEYVTVSRQENIIKSKMLEFLAQHPQALERSCTVGHFTASAWLLSNDLQRALLMHHVKLNKWLQLGGHCDGNPNLLEVAVKEAQEESGLTNIQPLNSKIFDIDMHMIPDFGKESAHTHYDVRFLLRVMDDAPIIKNSESHELRWCTTNLATFPTNEPSVIKMYKKWLQLLAKVPIYT